MIFGNATGLVEFCGFNSGICKGGVSCLIWALRLLGEIRYEIMDFLKWFSKRSLNAILVGNFGC